MKNINEAIKNIKQAFERGEKACLIIGSLTKEEIATVQKETGVEKIKDITPYYARPLPEEERKEYENFIMDAIKAQIDKFKHVHYLEEDGSIGVKMIELPTFVVVYEPNFFRKNKTVDLDFLARFTPPTFLR